ncbi:LytR/AlgR family response regulator transcription factor [Hymenobacter ruricola]|uniref:Response regulator transcription factor n=1 Tax=Hymenobacter ruricola TaxID=2791023 RepID=A0ABS0I182_9BACT|nr:LytTR family DNA-binding domain-containing protein [Hymenobacter ruricola]MBF9220692.1 response regulator transcription factor [Hymenobacter ruricola]
MKAVIIEDELHSREFLKNVLQELCPEVELLGTAESVPTGVALLNRTRPDLVFLDIEMQSGTGFDLLQQVGRGDFAVVFTTAYDHYALQAIKFSAIDYLLKPLDLDELQAAVGKVRDRLARPAPAGPTALDQLLATLSQPARVPQTITLATSDGLEFVPLSSIVRIEAAGAYSTFYLKGEKKIVVSKNLKEYEGMLPAGQFFRVHNSHIINLAEVRRMVRTDGGYAVMSDGATVLISPKKKDEFLQLMTGREA